MGRQGFPLLSFWNYLIQLYLAMDIHRNHKYNTVSIHKIFTQTI